MTYQVKYPKARLSPAKDELVVVEFARRHIESGDIGEILKALKPMSANPLYSRRGALCSPCRICTQVLARDHSWTRRTKGSW